jgi:fucose permease
MAGRLFFGFAVGFTEEPPRLRLWLAALAAGHALLTIGGSPLVAAAGLATAGFASGPVFPSLISATPVRAGVRHTANTVGFQIAAASLGQSVVPWLVGVAAARAGLEAIGPALLGGAILLIGVHELLPATGARREATGEPARG